jgi:arginase
MKPTLQIINAPFDLCGRSPGSRLGPWAMHLAGLDEQLVSLGWNLEPISTPIPLTSKTLGPAQENTLAGLEASKALAQAVAQARDDGLIPLVIGGDHSLAMGSISGAMLQNTRLGVLWIDAHMDLNTPETSETKNLHGMPLAALTRLKSGQPGEDLLWQEILTGLGTDKGLAGDCVSWLGLRDVDAGEVKNLARLPGSLAMTMQDVDRDGILGCITKLKAWIRERGITELWISFDVDSLDPLYAPGTGTAVRGGLTYREGHLLAELLHEMIWTEKLCRLAGVDIVEVNPLQDKDNETAKVATEWTASLFGKTILGSLNPGRTE